MSAEAAIADVCDAVVAPSAAATALLVVDGGSGDAAHILVDAVVAEDCVAVKDKLRRLHDASLESMRLYFGQVRPAAELIGIWQAADKVSSKALSG
jgi:hypothetical protein